MNRSMSFVSLLCALSFFCVVFSAPTSVLGLILVQNDPIDLYDVLPRSLQGENGIYLEYRRGGTSEYTYLTNFGDYNWKTPNTPWNLPTIERLSEAGVIAADASAVYQVGYDRDSVMRVSLDTDAPQIRITGSCYTAGYSNMIFAIFIGPDNWSSPLRTMAPGETFDLTVPILSGDQVYFTVTATPNDINGWARWRDIQLTAVPEPTSLSLLSIFSLSCISRRRRG